MKKTSFDRIAAAMLIGSLGYTAWFLAGLDWQRYRSFGITADLAWTPSSYIAFLLPPALVLLLLVARRLLFGGPAATQSGQVLFNRLRAMSLPEGSFAVFGSGPLAVRGLIDEIGDLDIIVREPAWSRVRDVGTSVMYGDHLTIDHGNGLTFGRSWAYGDFDVEISAGDPVATDEVRYLNGFGTHGQYDIPGDNTAYLHGDLIRSTMLGRCVPAASSPAAAEIIPAPAVKLVDGSISLTFDGSGMSTRIRPFSRRLLKSFAACPLSRKSSASMDRNSGSSAAGFDSRRACSC